jgi:SAM-dependent methyltransferase
MADFSHFDARGYRTVDVRTGYGEWVATYGNPVVQAMDLPLLEQLDLPWPTVEAAADLGCGTGRTGTWLKSKGVAEVDGVDLTPEMLAVARSSGMYRRLIEAEVSDTGLPAGSYDLVTACLIDDHLADVGPLYREARRLAKHGAFLVVVSYHSHFIMASGMPTHYHSASGEPVAIETHVHLVSEHVSAGLANGWTLVEMREQVIDDSWVALKPRWEEFRGHPFTAALAWRKNED